MSSIKVKKSSGLSGEIKIPGDKSISHRAAMIASLAHGTSHIKNFLFSKDCLCTVECMRFLGIEIKEETTLFAHKKELVIKGKGLHGLRAPSKILYVGNSGTTIRLLSGILSGQQFSSSITGDMSIKRRPMKRVIDPLQLMGAQISGENNDTKAPIAIDKGFIKPIEYELPVASAQVKSAIIFAALYADGTTVIKENVHTRDHTERMLKYFGAEIDKVGDIIKVKGNPYLKAKEIDVPSDISSGAFFIVGATVVPNSSIVMKNIIINPTRFAIIEVLQRMGANIEIKNERTVSNEPRADIYVKSSSNLKAINLSGIIIPKIIDEIPILVLAATQAQGTTIIKGAHELRLKESDRIATISSEFRKLGAKIEELEDGMIIHGGSKLSGSNCKSHFDHRIAMTLCIAGLLADGETIVEGTEFIETSFPGFKEIISK